MKTCWILLYNEVKIPIIQYIHVNLLAPTQEHYSYIHLLLQRDELAPSSGEAKVHYNTIQALSKIVLSEDFLPKSLYNDL